MSETYAGNEISTLDLLHILSPGWVRERRLNPIPDQPIVHAVCSAGSEELIEQFATHLGSVVPNAELDVGMELPPIDPAADRHTPEASARQRARSVAVRKLLDDAVVELRDHASAARMGRLRFPRYALTSWLLKKNLRATDPRRASNSDIRDELHSYLKAGRRKPAAPDERKTAAWSSVFENLPWYVAVLALVAFPLYYALWTRRGRVPRWLLRQQYLAPKESADFPGFAQRLIRTPSENENADQVRKLLVHAFLSDLADSYTRRLWRWRWVAKDCYPVLLLKDLRPGTVGELLVRLLNDVRNETGAHDPLLVVAVSDTPLEGADAPKNPLTLDEWKHGLTDARRKRSSTAWYVPLRVAPGPVELPSRAVLKRKHSERWRRVPLVLVLLLVLGSTTGYAWQVENHCGQWLPWRDANLRTVEVLGSPDQHECIGLSDGTYKFSAEAPQGSDAEEMASAMEEVQQQIIDSNEEAETAPTTTGHPIPTVVYLGMLTAADRRSSALDGTLQDLRGIAAAQESGLMRHRPFRALLANAGTAMGHAPETAEQIVAAASRDASVVGVIGLGGSWETTAKAIEKLGKAGLPSIGTTTSATELPNRSNLFYQVAPSNKREAEIIAHYLRKGMEEPPEHVHIYYSSKDELYSKDLAEKSRAALGEDIGITMHDQDTPEDSAPSPCGPNRTVLFADRADRFHQFLGELEGAACDIPPHLLAGDDTSKFVLAQQSDYYKDLPIDYVSFSEKLKSPPPDLTGRGLLTFDAITVVQTALDRAGNNAVLFNGQTVWRGIASIDEERPIPGTTGELVFWKPGKDTQPVQVPVDKAISVLRVVGGHDEKPEIRLQCGKGVPEPTPGCPAG